MIHVDCQPEPADFDQLVRQPGRRFLARTPRPTSRQWNQHSYWRKILRLIHQQYGGICAYSCHWISPDTGAETVEHFLPKDLRPDKAYEWDNYRLVCGKLNGRKGVHQDVLDPFEIETGWFTIDFPSLLVKPSENLEVGLVERVRQTIKRLGLNDEDTCLKSRARYVECYCKGKITFDHLRCEAPFLALELQRKNLVTEIRNVMIYE